MRAEIDGFTYAGVLFDVVELEVAVHVLAAHARLERTARALDAEAAGVGPVDDARGFAAVGGGQRLVEAAVDPDRSQHRMLRVRRESVPRESHAHFRKNADRPDPVAILEAQNLSRAQKLVPVRFAREMGAQLVIAVDITSSSRIGSIGGLVTCANSCLK